MITVILVDTDWNMDFQEWLEPFLAVFKRSEQRCWAPLYLQGLIGPGARKSVEPMAERFNIQGNGVNSVQRIPVTV
jgi:SRSO17 transposase